MESIVLLAGIALLVLGAGVAGGVVVVVASSGRKNQRPPPPGYGRPGPGQGPGAHGPHGP